MWYLDIFKYRINISVEEAWKEWEGEVYIGLLSRGSMAVKREGRGTCILHDTRSELVLTTSRGAESFEA